MFLEFFVVLAMLLMPFNFLGEEFSSVIFSLLLSIYLLLRTKDKIKINKKYLYAMLALLLLGTFSLFFSNSLTQSLSGLCIYLDAVFFYIIFSKLKDEETKINKWIVYIISISAAAFIIYQGVFLKVRIDGNIGYANTYALILVIALYINETLTKNKFHNVIQLVLMTSILFTGSRNTLLYLLIFILVDVYIKFKHKNFTTLANLFTGILVFLLLETLGLGFVLLLPIILFFVFSILNKLSNKQMNIYIGITAIAGSFSLFIFNTDLLARLKNISMNNGVLQERLVYYTDVIKNLFKHPLGSGINSFEYSQYSMQTAFYDVKYVHNSILQAGYDMGFLGIILFLFVGILGFIILIKSSNLNKRVYIPLYLTIYLHSLLDFDFSYAVIIAFIAMIVAFCNEAGDTLDFSLKSKKAPIIAVFILSLYLCFTNSAYLFGDVFASNNDLNAARTIYSINRIITYKDPQVYLKLADIDEKDYSLTKDTNKLDSCIYNLKLAEKINPKDPRIQGNLAFAYEKANNPEETIQYYESFLGNERFYSEMYRLYYKFLTDQFKKTQNIYFQDKIKHLAELFYKNSKELNPKARYMKDQLPSSFDEIKNSASN